MHRTLALALFLSAGPALAQVAASDLEPIVAPIGEVTLPTALPVSPTAPASERAQQRMAFTLRSTFERMTAEGPVTTRRLERTYRRQLAERRAGVLSLMLRNDLDGDGHLSADEVNSIFGPGEGYNSAMVDPVRDADANGDGAVSMAEMLMAARDLGDLSGSPIGRGDPAAYLGVFDDDRDGVVSAAEIDAALPSMDDLMAAATGARLPGRADYGLADKGRDCNANTVGADTVGPDTTLVSLGAIQGGHASPVSLFGQDFETTVAKVRIEPGTRPVTVFASSPTPVIWQVEGATDRVRAFVVAKTKGIRDRRMASNAGVAGLARARVRFLDAGCLPQPGAARARLLVEGRMTTLAGRKPDVTVSPTEVYQSVSLPGGTVEVGDRAERLRGLGRDRIMIDNRLVDLKTGEVEVAPNGGDLFTLPVADIGVEDVVAAEPVERYAVMPGHSGLAQLVREGKLERVDGRTYRVVAPIARFPSGLNGGYSVEFVLARGIDMPDGSPGHSDVYSEEMGELIAGARFRMEQMRRERGR